MNLVKIQITFLSALFLFLSETKTILAQMENESHFKTEESVVSQEYEPLKIIWQFDTEG